MYLKARKVCYLAGLCHSWSQQRACAGRSGSLEADQMQISPTSTQLMCSMSCTVSPGGQARPTPGSGRR